ncbi:MAG: D-galactonate dehydratase family protein [Armatimonadetes bacterium]|nr:D-galactonate dehydratase family protein [Armatimonadota bacterium]MDW8122651.1 D-galactonate dehydratase family protein [Armatimonadota bacterium]
MKITDMGIWITNPTGSMNYVVIKVITDEGIYGVGEGTLYASEPIVAETLKVFRELLIGRDPALIEDTWYYLHRSSYWRGGPLFKTALAAVDMALWDIKGKVANLPVYQLLGGACRTGVVCYRHADGRDPVEVEDNVRRLMEEGMKVIRAQMGGYGGSGKLRTEPAHRPGLPSVVIYEPARYLLEVPKLFEHLRAQLGMEIELLHDVHEQLSPLESAQLAKALEPYRLFFLEDPVSPENKEGLALIRRASTTPIAIGEIISDRETWLTLFLNRWIDYIRIAPLHVGGITEAKKIMTLAEPFGVKSAFHGAGDLGPISQAAALHVQMAIPNMGVQEWTDFASVPVLQEVFPEPCRLVDGYARPNEKPGLGIDFNTELAEKYPYKPVYMPHIRRADGTLHGY